VKPVSPTTLLQTLSGLLASSASEAAQYSV